MKGNGENMMDADLEKAIMLACLKAIEALGDKHLGMLCLLWGTGRGNACTPPIA